MEILMSLRESENFHWLKGVEEKEINLKKVSEELGLLYR